jgi:hypothetical protein
MLSTYRAVLRGHILEWLSEKPEHLPTDRAISVQVTILDEAPQVVDKQQGRQMAMALEKLAKLPTSTMHATDAASWERELRQERVLPGRGNNAD